MSLEESLRSVYNLPQRRETGSVVNESEMQSNLTKALGSGAVSDAEIQKAATGLLGQESGAVIQEKELESTTNALMSAARGTADPEERESLMQLIEKLMVQKSAPFSDVAQELSMLGTGEDTQLVHARPGEVVIPPEMLQDEQFESMLEQKFNQFNIDPESAVVGVGIASLNQSTGLEEFGFFKKIGKKLKKVVKKVAPIAGVLAIPGIGGVLGSGLSKAGAALGIPSGLGSSVLGGKGILDRAAAIRGGIGGLFAGRGEDYDPATGSGQSALGRIEDTFKLITGDDGTTRREELEAAGYSKDQIDQLFANPAALNTELSKLRNQRQQTMMDQNLGEIGTGTSKGGLGMLGNLGIGALAATLGKLAYEDTKKQKGVPLTPLTTMDAVGRYNIESEIARRMGQQQPNPVEFGLLPEGTLPELTGGKPRGMYMGGIAAFAQGGAVAMQEGGEMNPNDFPRMDGDINGPGTETSDDIPAMLSDGEFVMTGRAVRGAGSFDMKNEGGIVTLMPTAGESRERGTNLMYKMMDMFEGQASGSS
jgi:hypothetical protein